MVIYTCLFCSFALPTSDISFKWLHAIKQELGSVQSFADYFAVSFYVASTAEDKAPWELHQKSPFRFSEELRRLGFDLQKTWRVSDINENYEYVSIADFCGAKLCMRRVGCNCVMSSN